MPDARPAKSPEGPGPRGPGPSGLFRLLRIPVGGLPRRRRPPAETGSRPPRTRRRREDPIRLRTTGEGSLTGVSTCATLSRELSEPLAATAATATTWLLVEQTGPWGAKALAESHLDASTGRALEAATAGTGVRVALIRRPGRHADCLPTPRQEVL
ncbi:hypothetical protein ACWC5I_11435, partial [Kitasatospora sp. NPDC001574]